MADWGLDQAESDFDTAKAWSGETLDVAGPWEFSGAVQADTQFDQQRNVDTDDAEDLPAVQAAARLGYEPATEAPLYCFLPAIWPRESRAWVRDIRIRHAERWADGVTERVPWSTWDYFDIESDYNEILRTCGFPTRPAGRLWLLKPPPGFASLNEVLEHVADSNERAGLEIYPHEAFAHHVASEIDQLFADQS